MTTAPGSLSDRALELARLTLVRRIITAGAVVASALLQAFLIQAFVNPANLLPSGFTGIAVLIDRITAPFGVRISTDLGMLALNIPLAFICWNRISKRFVFFSMMQVALSAAFLRIFDFQPLLDDQIMLVVFGGFLSPSRSKRAHRQAVRTSSRCSWQTAPARPSGASSLPATAPCS